MRPTGVKGNTYYGTSDGEFIRQRMQFCICSFCFRLFEFNERVVFFRDRSNEYYLCLDHEQQMRDKQISDHEEIMKQNEAWEEKKRELVTNLKIKKRKKGDESIKE